MRSAFDVNLGWVFAVLIFATIFSAAKYETTNGSNASASDVVFSVETSSLDSNAKRRNDQSAVLANSDAEILFVRLDSNERGARRASKSESKLRGGTNSTPSLLNKVPRFAFERSGGVDIFRYFWSCQAVSRPLFLVLQTLRN